MARNSNGFTTALGRLDLITSAFLMVFAVLGLIMTGLANEVLELLQTYTWLPFTLSLVCLVGVLMTSETRSPDYYHDGEKVFVSLVLVMMAVHAFTNWLDAPISSHSPWSSVIIFLVMVVAGAILAR